MARAQKVFTLLVQVGRQENDGLPEDASGAALLCYAAAKDEPEAVRETVAVLKTADLAPLDVTGYGDLDERENSGQDIDQEERDLMERAAEENAVIVAHVTPYFGEGDGV